MADLEHLTGIAEVTRANGFCHLQITNELLRDYSDGPDSQSVFKVRSSYSNGRLHELDASNMRRLALITWHKS